LRCDNGKAKIPESKCESYDQSQRRSGVKQRRYQQSGYAARMAAASRGIINSTQGTYQETVGALCRGDEKGIGNQYVSQDKCIIAGEITEEYSATNLVRRLTPLECERLQGYPDTY